MHPTGPRTTPVPNNPGTDQAELVQDPGPARVSFSTAVLHRLDTACLLPLGALITIGASWYLHRYSRPLWPVRYGWIVSVRNKARPWLRNLPWRSLACIDPPLTAVPLSGDTPMVFRHLTGSSYYRRLYSVLADWGMYRVRGLAGAPANWPPIQESPPTRERASRFTNRPRPPATP